MNEVAITEQRHEEVLEILLDENGSQYITSYNLARFSGKPHNNLVRSAVTHLTKEGINVNPLLGHQRHSNGNMFSILNLPPELAVAVLSKVDFSYGVKLVKQLLTTSPVGVSSVQHPASTIMNSPSAQQGDLVTLIRAEIERVISGHAAAEPSRLATRGPAEVIEIPDGPSLNAKEVGQVIGMSPQEVNRMFCEMRLQTTYSSGGHSPTCLAEGLYEVIKMRWIDSTHCVDRFKWKRNIFNKIPSKYLGNVTLLLVDHSR